MSDRRRINGPPANTHPLLFTDELSFLQKERPPADVASKSFLRTGVTPSASGSAYLEIERKNHGSLAGSLSRGLKLTCTVHGPQPPSRTTSFSPHLVLAAHVKYAPFATRHRKGYLRDTSERDLTVQLEAALRGAIMAERWPKSLVEVIVTVMEGDQPTIDTQGDGNEGWDLMNVLGACITVASAAMADAGIDCIDTVAGGVAAAVENANDDLIATVPDPALSEHSGTLASCCVAYLPSRGEITNLWVRGQLPPGNPMLMSDLISQATYGCLAAGDSSSISLHDSSGTPAANTNGPSQ